MSFTTSCFIRTNTPELRKQLEELGYCQASALPFSYLGTLSSLGVYVTIPVMSMQGSIDCGTNEPLFLAIAALRDDSDYMQWFVTEVEQRWVNLETYAPKGSFELCLIPDRYMGKDPLYCNSIVPAHKATVEELIEHFKIKEQ